MDADGRAGAVGPGVEDFASAVPALSNIWSNLALCWAGVGFSFSPFDAFSRSLLADLRRKPLLKNILKNVLSLDFLESLHTCINVYLARCMSLLAVLILLLVLCLL